LEERAGERRYIILTTTESHRLGYKHKPHRERGEEKESAMLVRARCARD
jgi:hypothetical protein